MTARSKKSPDVERTSTGLRNALFDEMDSLRGGTSNPAKSNAVAKLADQIVGTVRLEMDVQKHLTRHGQVAGDKKSLSNSVPPFGQPLALGSV